ncbi:3-hydroxyisobutyrate dehydrogenase [Pseudoclavibacter endophyticus]|uniref:NAD(P)-dependent oxidoreductase n=1 Tax=Pseudoclavibacter endophyticus TaxID=1778590 RepID=A0A6H9WK76_9MICO|nr:NAD(P)-dependent oxidoreductase [Pseudoclavibacter endophyticus]KAB1648139.1 NAD(P)-dependent oxidoreductase [Pseudoclavibacter endophyticus]GGA70060.1 3-hydroxyisobutyrate dehydrogenase [Pseudoclavibacter endophyticus]
MTTIGFIGVGAMGRPMVERLLAAGHDVVVWGRTPEKLQPVVDAGARLAESPAALAAQADTVLGCLLDGPAIEEIYLGRLLEAARPGQLFADHGTYDPRIAEKVHAAFAEKGAHFVDAPVSGGPMGAEAGTLVCAAGGDAAAVELLRPIAAAYTGRIAHMGAAGRGLMLKLINNYHVSINFVAAAETAWLIERLGLDAQESMAILFGGFADSACLRMGLPKALAGEYEAGGMPLGGLVEVQRNIADLLESNGFASGLFPYARQVFANAAVTEADQHPSALVHWLPGVQE